MGKVTTRKVKGLYKPKSLFLGILVIFIITNLLACATWYLLKTMNFRFTLTATLFWANLGALGVSGWLVLKNLVNNNFDMHRKEKLASSAWMPKEDFQKKYPLYRFNSGRYENGFIMNTHLGVNNERFSFNLSKAEGNALAIGSTYSGKTTSLMNPQIRVLATAKTKSSMLITDPKGELFKTHSKWLQKQGYEVFNLNLRNDAKTNFWNPLEKVWNIWKSGYKDKAASYLNELCESLVPKTDTKDPYFEITARDIMQFMALAYLEFSDMKVYQQTFVKRKFNIAFIIQNIHGNKTKDLQKISSYLPENSLAVYAGGKHLTSSAGKTVDSVLSTLTAKLSVYRDPVVRNVTRETDIKVDTGKPQVTFIIVPDETEAKYPFISLFVTEFYKELIEQAYENDSEADRLARPFYFLLDEFGNTPKIPNMEKMITVARSRNIYFMLLLQNYAQLDNLYGQHTATTIISNCAFEYFILTNDEKTARTFSNKLGDKTFKAVSRSSNAKGGSSSSSDRAKRLMSPDELTRLQPGEIVIKPQRELPVKNRFANLDLWTNFARGEMEVPRNPEVKDFNKTYFVNVMQALAEHDSEDVVPNQHVYKKTLNPDAKSPQKQKPKRLGKNQKQNKGKKI